MSELVRRVLVIMCGAGLAACGFPRPADVDGNDGAGDGGTGNGSNIDAAPQSEIPSCARLAITCGASGNDSCCNSPEVAGGTYFRSYDRAGDANSGNLNFLATVSDFRLDKYEVTVGRFRAFVNQGMGTQSSAPPPGAGAHSNIAGSGWDTTWNAVLAMTKGALVARLKCDSTFQTWTDTPGANEDRPINCLSWYEAMAFCAWDGGYLPTEAEWNYAATGGNEQRAYPWSTPPGSVMSLDGFHASYQDGANCVGDGMAGCAVTDLVPVGTKPLGDGRWGQSDLAGNVIEWVLDWYAVYPDPCVDCANLTAADIRVLRGGSFKDNPTTLRSGVRPFLDVTPPSRNSNIGVRCARAP